MAPDESDDIRDAADRLETKLTDEENRRETLKSTLSILILGDYDDDNLQRLREIRDRLLDHGFHAFLVEDKSDGVDVPDADIQKRLMQEANLIIAKDGVNVGTGIEYGMIQENENLQEKIFFLTHKFEFQELTDPTNNFIFYKQFHICEDEEELVERAVHIAKKEAHRIISNQIRNN